MSVGSVSFFPAVSVTAVYGIFITPDSLSKSNLPVGAATSNRATGNVTGGTGPFTFAWTQVSGDIFTINSPTDDNTTFSTTGVSGQEKSGIYKLTVTDTGAGNAEESDNVDVSFQFAGVPI